MIEQLLPLDLRAAGHLSGVASLVVVVLASLALVVIAVIGVVFARRETRRARMTRALADAPPDLADGWSVLSGEIEDDEIDAPAVQVDIEQARVTKRNKDEWHETKRSVRARPFSLRLDDGQRVRVEPGDDTRVIAPLNVNRAVRADERLRAATIRAGKHVVVTGVLTTGFVPSATGQGYRDAGKGLVLAPPARGSMLISTDSVESLAQSQIERAAMHRRQMKFALAALVLGHAVMLWRYDVLLVAGRMVSAAIDDGARRVYGGEGSEYKPEYFVRSTLPNNTGGPTRVLESHVTIGTYFRTRFAPRTGPNAFTLGRQYFEHSDPELYYRAAYDLDAVLRPAAWWRVVPGTSIHEIGREATAHGGAAISLALLAGLLALVYALSAQGKRAWWEGTKLVEKDQ